MPGAGGTYIYLREAFQYRTGRLMPFLFVWTAVLFIPPIMATGVIGLGLIRPLALHAAQPGHASLPRHPLTAVSILLLLKAFSAGCSALTGVEAIAKPVERLMDRRGELTAAIPDLTCPTCPGEVADCLHSPCTCHPPG
ncbi:MAG TPA: hypothetical protein VFV73_36405 [Streptosporangiaceae bacterium]|nr:hypothetical protein [Streptosporangiaceae bacterium]